MLRRPYSPLLAALLAGAVFAGGCDGDASDGADAAGSTDDGGAQANKLAPAPAPKDEPSPAEAATDKAAAERKAASSDSTATVAARPPLKIDQLIVASELEPLFGKDAVAQSPLVGRAPTPKYNALRYHPPNNEGYGVGLQVWAFANRAEANKYLENLRPQYLGLIDVPKTAPIKGKSAFAAERAGIRTYAFAHPKVSRVVAVSCDVTTCKEWEKLVDIGEGVAHNLEPGGDEKAQAKPKAKAPATRKAPAPKPAKPSKKAEKPTQ